MTRSVIGQMNNDAASLFSHLSGETGRIAWRALLPWFARGDTLQVAAGLDLVAVATALASDDASTVQGWLTSGELAPVSDQQAAQWQGDDAEVWAVVVLPWILVQSAQG